VQLLYETQLTSTAYVTQQGWQQATLDCCPTHGARRCGFARHGTYNRVEPPGTLVVRYYCPKAKRTFSLLPSCLAARLGGSLDEVEQIVVAAEAAPSQEVAAAQLRPDIELPGALRWLRRRLGPVRAVVLAVATLWPGRLTEDLTLTGVRDHLGTKRALVELRTRAAPRLSSLAPPVGFGPRPLPRRRKRRRVQHEMGPDPPARRR
jgi:hypothetical protein